MAKFYIFAQVTLLSLIDTILSQTDVRFVFSVISNGASSPSSITGGKDILTESWDTPLELTGTGQRMGFLLGQNYQKKYSSFLQASYSPSEIYARSSENINSLMNAQSVLQGIYGQSGPAISNTLTNAALPPVVGGFDVNIINSAGAIPSSTQVFPVHSFSQKELRFFYHYGLDICSPITDNIYKNKALDTPYNFAQNFNKNFGSFISKAYGLDSNYYTDIVNINSFMDAFSADYYHGKGMKILKDANLDLKDLNKTSFDFSKTYYYDVLNGDTNYILAKLVSASYIEDLLNWMQTRVTNDINNKPDYVSYTSPKMVLYFSNNLFVSAVVKFFDSVLGLSTVFSPPAFESSFQLELRRVSTGKTNTEADYSIDFIFNDNLILIKSIPYTDFKNKLTVDTYYSSTQVEDYCFGWGPIVAYLYRKATIGMGVLFVFFFLLFIITLIVCCCCYRRKGRNYESIKVTGSA